MIRFIYVLFIPLFYSSYVNAWTISRDFEGGVVGASAQDSRGFDSVAGSARYTNKFAASGKQSISTTIQKGTTGFGQWGGRFSFPNNLRAGDELWVRTYFYFPNTFDFTTIGTGLKTVRIHTPEGNIDTYTLKKNGNSTALMAWSELAGSDFGANNPGGRGQVNSSGFNRGNVGTAVPKGEWHVLEQYVKFATKPNSGIFRIWQNGKLIFEDTKTYTLKTSSSEADFVALFTYWNSYDKASNTQVGAPQTQTMYIDNVVLTTDRPSNTDSFGNPFIGTGNVEFVATPAPPNPPSLK